MWLIKKQKKNLERIPKKEDIKEVSQASQPIHKQFVEITGVSSKHKRNKADVGMAPVHKY